MNLYIHGKNTAALICFCAMIFKAKDGMYFTALADEAIKVAERLGFK